MDARNLTELLKANDDNKPNHADKSGDIAVDVLPTGSVLFGTLEIQLLEQMPLRGNPAHPHFIPLLPGQKNRPRKLHQQPHAMKDSTVLDYSDLGSFEDFKSAAANANLIFAINSRDEGQRGIVWGHSLLSAISQEIIPPQECRAIGFRVDFGTTELEHLHAATQVLFGCHDGNFSEGAK
jgi:hypothetical protein